MMTMRSEPDETPDRSGDQARPHKADPSGPDRAPASPTSDDTSPGTAHAATHGLHPTPGHAAPTHGSHSTPGHAAPTHAASRGQHSTLGHAAPTHAPGHTTPHTKTPPRPRTAPTPNPARRALLGRILREPLRLRSLRELLYVTLALPLTAILILFFFVGFAVSVPLSVTVVGLPLLAALVLLGRSQGSIHRAMARGLLGRDIPPPHPFRRPPGVFGWLGSALGHAEGWRGIVYLPARLPLAIAGVAAAWMLWGMGLVLLTYPLWLVLFRPQQTDENGHKYTSGIEFDNNAMNHPVEVIALSLLGAALLLAAPWVVRGITWADAWLMNALLGPTRMGERVRDLEETRAIAVDDSAARLRRIERDLHDGAQARIVALAMHLSQARDHLDAEQDEVPLDIGKARGHVDSALGNARIAITELRDLARGIHPPVLDQGLDAALATLVAGCAVPVSLHTRIDRRPPASLESIAYFCTAELLTNAARHGGATSVTVEAVREPNALVVRVTDNGRGGARLREGGGLAGLVERVRTVDGTVEVDSPRGGPTRMTVRLPVRDAGAGTGTPPAPDPRPTAEDA